MPVIITEPLFSLALLYSSIARLAKQGNLCWIKNKFLERNILLTTIDLRMLDMVGIYPMQLSRINSQRKIKDIHNNI
jgi:hypothetical protein